MHCARCYFYDANVGDEVCDRCGRAYLPGANVYLGLLVLVTGGAAWALRNILTGDIDPLVRPSLDLGAWATWPVSMVDCPGYAFVIGAWLGMLGVVPIMAGMQYGKRGGWLLAIIIALAGPSVVMAAAIAMGVWISSSRTLRLGSKTLSLFLGLVPVAAYWYLATAWTDFTKIEVVRPAGAVDFVPAVVTARMLPPALRSLTYVLPASATVAAMAVGLVVVGLGWIERWNVRWPSIVLALAAVSPAISLAAFIGIDEVRYGYLLENPGQQASGETTLTSDVKRLSDFLDRHPQSPRAAEVDAQIARLIDQPEIGQQRGAPSPWDLWANIYKNHNSSEWSADARLHLGDSAARQGRCFRTEKEEKGAEKVPLAERSAQSLWEEADSQTLTMAEVPARDPLEGFSGILDFFSVGASLQEHQKADHFRGVRRDVLVRLALLPEKAQRSPTFERAFSSYFDALYHKSTADYRKGLLAAAEVDPKGPLVDNIACDLAMLETPEMARLAALDKVAKDYPGTDGAMLAHLAAAQILITRADANNELSSWKSAREHLRLVQAELVRLDVLAPQTDPYVKALKISVDKKLAYVDAQLPPEPPPTTPSATSPSATGGQTNPASPGATGSAAGETQKRSMP
jgi:hypothetical protein